VVVIVNEGVVYVELVVAASVFNKDPPEAAEYHLNVPDDVADALRFVVPDPQMEPVVMVGDAGGVSTVADTSARVLVQVPLSNST
jgi:hypothetical protein